MSCLELVFWREDFKIWHYNLSTSSSSVTLLYWHMEVWRARLPASSTLRVIVHWQQGFPLEHIWWRHYRLHHALHRSFWCTFGIWLLVVVIMVLDDIMRCAGVFGAHLESGCLWWWLWFCCSWWIMLVMQQTTVSRYVQALFTLAKQRYLQNCNW